MESVICILLSVWLAVVNLAGLVLMAADKSRARRGRWRVPERMLFLTALLGGAAGSWAGMYLFHHKTRRDYFAVGLPLMLAAQAAVLFCAMNL